MGAGSARGLRGVRGESLVPLKGCPSMEGVRRKLGEALLASPESTDRRFPLSEGKLYPFRILGDNVTKLDRPDTSSSKSEDWEAFAWPS